MPNIIVFGPHPDDQEIGMGASIAMLADQGHSVLLVDVTDGSPTPRGDRASRLLEAQAALAALQPSPAALARGARPISRILLDLPNRMVEHSLATRHLFAGAIRAHQASIIFTPWPVDAHPDHLAVTRSVEDARFDAKLTKITMPTPPQLPPGCTALGPPIYPKWLFYYHVSHLRATISPSFLLDVTGYQDKKIAAVKAYRSQFGPWDDSPPGGPALRAGRPHGAPDLRAGQQEQITTSDSSASGPDIQSPFSPGDPKAPATPPGHLVSTDLPNRLLAYSAYMGSLIGTAHAEPFLTKEPIGLTSLSTLPI